MQGFESGLKLELFIKNLTFMCLLFYPSVERDWSLSQNWLTTINAFSLFYLTLMFSFFSPGGDGCPGTWRGHPLAPWLGPEELSKSVDWQVELE